MIKGIFDTYVNGKLVDSGPNAITNLGRKWVLDMWRGQGSTGSTVPWMINGSAYLAVGEGSGLTIATMSGLYNELGAGSGARAQFSNVSRGVDAGSAIIGSVSYGGSGAMGALWEVGVFVTGMDGATRKEASTTKDSGILFARRVFNNQVTVNSGGTINLVYKYILWDS